MQLLVLRRLALMGLCLAPLAAVCAPTSDLDRNTVVVSQAGATVTVGDVDAYMARLPADKWAGFISSAERIETMLKDLLRTKQLATQARELKLDRDPDAQSQLALAQDDVLAKLRFQKFTDSIKVPDLSQLAKEEYLAHTDQYTIPADVTVQQILISTDGRTDDDARKLADTVRAQATADFAQFDALVEKYSDDPQKGQKKGVVKDATSSKMVTPFANAAGKLDAKAPISPVIKSKYGYHILKLISATPARTQTFDEVKAKILAGLDAKYVSNQRKDFLNQLASQKMDPNPDAIASLHARYFTGTGVPVVNPPESAGAKSLKPELEAKQ